MPVAAVLAKGRTATRSGGLYTDATDPFSFGLRPDQDHLLLAPLPADPAAAETMNVWIHDGERNTGVNLHAHMKAGEMTCPVSVFLPDGRLLRTRGDGPGPFTDPLRPHSPHVHYACEQPFRRWSFEAKEVPVWVTDHDELAKGVITDETPTTTVSLRATATMLSPAWIQGSLLPEAYDAVADTEAGLWIAARLNSGMHPESYRFEQTIVAEGAIEFEGKTYPFKGYGLRGHVRGARALGGMHGHTWMSGAAPSGLGFGLISMPAPEGGFYFSEGFIHKDGVMHPSRVRYAPLMSFDPNEGDFVVELVNDELGLTRIVGRDVRPFLWSMVGSWGKSGFHYGLDPRATMGFRQALARFEILGETAYGMNERSGPRD